MLWADPLALDPSRASARVTRGVAVHLAEVAKSLEAAGHTPEAVAGFLTRCLFCMFAEDVGLLPAHADGSGGFVGLLKRSRSCASAALKPPRSMSVHRMRSICCSTSGRSRC